MCVVLLSCSPTAFPADADHRSGTEEAPCGPSCFAKMLLEAIFFLGTSSLASWLFISNDRLTFPGAFPQVPKHVLAVPSAAAGRGCPRLSTGCKSQEAFSGGFAEAVDLGTVTEGFVVSISLAAPASVGSRGKICSLFYQEQEGKGGAVEEWDCCGGFPPRLGGKAQTEFPMAPTTNQHPRCVFSIFFSLFLVVLVFFLLSQIMHFFRRGHGCTKLVRVVMLTQSEKKSAQLGAGSR